MQGRELEDKDRLFYFERNFFTLDGLWIIEVEKELGVDKSLEIDRAVWEKLLSIAFRRIQEYLGIGNSVADLIDILAFRWSCERWEFEILSKKSSSGSVRVKKCPYHEIMKRNPGRARLAPRICKEICIPIYEVATKSINPGIIVTRRGFLGIDGCPCIFDFKLETGE